MFKLSKLHFSAISYQTEDIDMVNECFNAFLPDDYLNEIKDKIVIQHLTGQFGDSIRVHSLEVKKKKYMKAIIKHVLNLLPEKEKQKFLDEFTQRFDEYSKKMYLRFDKFKAKAGHLNLISGSDILKFEIKYDIYTKTEVSEIYKDFLVLLED